MNLYPNAGPRHRTVEKLQQARKDARERRQANLQTRYVTTWGEQLTFDPTTFDEWSAQQRADYYFRGQRLERMENRLRNKFGVQEEWFESVQSGVGPDPIDDPADALPGS